MANSAAMPVQQRAWETRERILDAAVTCLAEHGYTGATTARIQDRSGISRGSLLHQFPTKEDLLIAAVQHLAAAQIAEIEQQAAQTTGDIDAAVDALWATLHGRLFAAALELWIAAKNNPDLAHALAPQEHQLGRAIRDAITAMFGPRLADHSYFDELVSLLLSSMRGVALTYTFEPRAPAREPHLDTWKRLARAYLP